MQHLDEGMIHAWLDGELSLPEREALEAHIAECAQCAAAVAEARGFVAASTRILTALDSVPGGVLPASSTGSETARPAVRRRFVASRAWMAAAAVLVLSTVTVIAIKPGDDTARLRVVAAAQDKKELSESVAPVAPSEEKPQSPTPTTNNAPASVQADTFAPADKPKSVDQTERLKSRLEAERQLTRPRSNNGAPPPMADAVAPARAVPAPMARVAEQPATVAAGSAIAKDAAEKRADVLAKVDSTSVRRTGASAQGFAITGRVTSEAGAPLASASVLLEGTGIGTITHDDGSYALVVPASRANGQSTSLVAKLIGYKASAVPITPASEPATDSITHDFVLRANPLVLQQLVVTTEGASALAGKAPAAIASDSASVDSVPTLLSRNTIHADGDTVVTSVYSVRGVSVSLTEHSRARDEAGRLQLRNSVSEMSAKSRKAAAAVNTISWSDSTGHSRTLRGPLTTEQLTQLKNTLFSATP